MELPNKRQHISSMHVPPEPCILLSSYFLITMDNIQKLVPDVNSYNMPEKISNLIEEFIERCPSNITFSSSHLSWSGTILKTTCHCLFRICLYRSKKNSDTYIIECHRTAGDHWIFGEFFQKVKKIYFPPSVEPVYELPQPIPSDDEDADDEDADDEDADFPFINNMLIEAKSMINDEDYKVSLNGIQMISSICPNPHTVNSICESSVLPLLVAIVKRIDMYIFEVDWIQQYALLSLLNLADAKCAAFIYYANVTHFANGESLYNVIKSKLEHIESQRDYQEYISPSKQHLFNNSKKLLNIMTNHIIKKRMQYLIAADVFDKMEYNETKFSKFIKAKSYWKKHVISFL